MAFLLFLLVKLAIKLVVAVVLLIPAIVVGGKAMPPTHKHYERNPEKYPEYHQIFQQKLKEIREARGMSAPTSPDSKQPPKE